MWGCGGCVRLGGEWRAGCLAELISAWVSFPISAEGAGLWWVGHTATCANADRLSNFPPRQASSVAMADVALLTKQLTSAKDW